MLRTVSVAALALAVILVMSSKARSGLVASSLRTRSRVMTVHWQAVVASMLAQRGPPSRLISPK